MQGVTLWARSTQIMNVDGRDMDVKRTSNGTYSAHCCDIIAKANWVCGNLRRAFRSGLVSYIAYFYHFCIACHDVLLTRVEPVSQK